MLHFHILLKSSYSQSEFVAALLVEASVTSVLSLHKKQLENTQMTNMKQGFMWLVFNKACQNSGKESLRGIYTYN